MARGKRVHLLDVNVLVALFDPGHIHHDTAHNWFASVGSAAWASCPLTENGFVRVLSNPAYPGRRTTAADAAGKLGQLTGRPDHTFWEDGVSILDPTRFVVGALTGYREITDAYLLALAVSRFGALATLDGGIRVAAVVGAEPRHVALLGR